jgi:hypothetical protein
MDIYEFYQQNSQEIIEIFNVITSEYPHTQFDLFTEMLFYNNLNAKQFELYIPDFSFNELSCEKIETILRFYDDILSHYLSFGIIFISLAEFVKLICCDAEPEDRHDNCDV